MTPKHPSLHLTAPSLQRIEGEISLPTSKSESNRLLIMNALSADPAPIYGLSTANDTQLLERLLSSREHILDAHDAGTTFRFLTAYCAITNRPAQLTGTPRMQQRPIGILVDALRALGAEIDYLGKEGFPPLHIRGFAKQHTDRLQVRGDISSQFLSALLMVAPRLPQGLTLEIIPPLRSKPYLEMTLRLMHHFGIRHTREQDTITIAPQAYHPVPYTVEADWSAASYWYAFGTIFPDVQLLLRGLRRESLQGDQHIVRLMEQLGIKTRFEAAGAKLSPNRAIATDFIADFADCPDLAQTVAVICAARGVKATLTGVSSLKIKETDRLAALQQELQKIGVLVRFPDADTLCLDAQTPQTPELPMDTYKDHRMAMCLAPLVALGELTIRDPEVVRKSYPHFWDDCERIGIQLTTTDL